MPNPTILPCPRMELRWRDPTDDEAKGSALPGGVNYVCDYGVVMPVQRNDIRSNVYDEENDVEMTGVKSEVFHVFGSTMRGGDKPPRDTETPFRDGVHAAWDAKILGLEVWIVGLFGDRNKSDISA